MKVKFFLIMTLLIVVGLSNTLAQGFDPIAEIDNCLGVFENLKNTSAPDYQEFRLVLPGKKTPSIDVGIQADSVVFFHCPLFSIDQDSDSAYLVITGARGKSKRRFNSTDYHALRWYLSLNPFWVLQHVKRRIDNFTYAYDKNAYRCVYTYEKKVILSAPSEKVYGLYEEVLTVDTVNHLVIDYSITALDEDMVAIQDLYNTYTYQKETSPEWIRVSQGVLVRRGNSQDYKVIY